ncbi:MAG: hypothetical protein ACQESK_11060 [Bacteroidota bacterium]
MNFCKQLLSLYVNASIHVSFSVVAFVLATYKMLAIPVSLNLLYFVFFASITGYNFVKYAGVAGLHHISLTKNLRLIQIFSLLSFILMIYFAFQLSVSAWFVLFPLGLLNLFYAVPLFFKAKNLRSIPLLKVFVITVVWTGVSVYLPVEENGARVDNYTHIFALHRAIIVFCLMIPFEIRDIRFDAQSIKTLPQVLGISKTKLLGGGLLLLSLSISFVFFEETNFLINAFLCFVLMAFIMFSKTHQSKYFASFWVEGLPIIYLLGLWLLS